MGVFTKDARSSGQSIARATHMGPGQSSHVNPPLSSMPASLAGLRYPSSRVLLPRTRLAYIHLRNLLTDAKRDRAARVSAYVAIWLPEELVTFYLRTGEVVNATVGNAQGSRVVAISEALELVPAEPEYGEICFHEAEPEQLACMYMAQTIESQPWPNDMAPSDASKLFPFLMSTVFDGAVEILADDTLNYLIFEGGTVARAFLAAAHHGTLVDRVAKLFTREGRVGKIELRRWPGPLALPEQAPPRLIQAYRELTTALIQALVERGRSSAPEIAEHARANLVSKHPSLDGFSTNGRVPCDPVCDSKALTSAVAAWVKDVIWAGADPDSVPPEELLKKLTWERRHLFQSAGLFEKLPWKLT